MDYAGATPVSGRVLSAMAPYWQNKFHNPSAIYLSAKSAKKEIEDFRFLVAKIIGVKPAEIIFTAGATEANNLAIHGVMAGYPGAEILTSSIEHDSVLAPAGHYNHRTIPVKSDGIIDLDKLHSLLNDKTILISVMLISNELGTIQPLREVAKAIDTVRDKRRNKGINLPLYLHCDAAQAPGILQINIARLGVDLLSLNGGKIYGPKQSGILYRRGNIELQPLMTGGGQEFGLRPGTENLAAIAGFSVALEETQSKIRTEKLRLEAVRNLFIDGIIKEFPEARINGSNKLQSPHILSVTFAGVDNERLVMELDEAGIECSSGSACSAGSDKPSHTLEAIGLNAAEARSTLRFSFGRHTTLDDIQQTLKVLRRLINR